jgi:hypothetical protein
MTTFILALQPGLESKYEDFSYQRQGFAGKNKKNGTLEVLPTDAFRIVPLTELLPELRQMVNQAVAEQAAELAPKLVSELVKELDKGDDSGDVPKAI